MVQLVRENWIDAAKGVLILLVVAGHAFGMASHLGPDVMSNLMLEKVYKVIYFFHMPAFFVLAGITWSDGHKGFGAYVLKKAYRLMVPYLVFGILSLMIECALAGTFSWRLFLCGSGCAYNGPLWFLPCMFVCEIVYYGLQRASVSVGRWRLLLPIALLAIGGCFSSCPLIGLPGWMPRVPVFLMFMAVGQLTCSRSRLSYFLTHARAMSILSFVLVGVFAVVGWHLPWEAECHGVVSFVSYRALAVVGTAVVFVVAQAIPVRPLVFCGSASLGILVLHKFPLSGVQLRVPIFAHLTGTASAMATLALTVAVTMLCWLVTATLRRTVPWVLGESRSV